MTNDATSDRSLFAPLPRRGPLTLLLDLFSSVKLGIVLMVLLFVYSSVGSAGIVYPVIGPGQWNILDRSIWRHDMIRQWPIFEMTEFEWFHTTFFNGLIALLCVNITVTTLRRIRLTALSAGVWMVHAGILILCLGSVIYFGTKFEGDTPVVRNSIVIEVPGAAPARLTAMPGNSTTVETDRGAYRFQVMQIDPTWELLSGEDTGKRAYAVTVSVESPDQSFMRQLLAGYPQYTEDVIAGKGRVKNIAEFGGRVLVDETLKMSLEYAPQDQFWLKESAALYVRDAGETRWAQRPIRGLPRYNDYFSALDDIWPQRVVEGDRPLRPRLLSMEVEAESSEGDALKDVTARVTGFLRYAVMHTGFEPGGPVLNPMAEVSIAIQGREPVESQLLALDEKRRMALAGNLTFDWVADEKELATFGTTSPRELRITLPDHGIDRVIPFTLEEVRAQDPEAPLLPLGESGFSYRIRGVVDRFPMLDGSALPLLKMDIQTPEGQKIMRWVFEEVARIRDNVEGVPENPHKPTEPDARIVTRYVPGRLLAPLAVVAGPGDIGVRLFADDGKGSRTEHRLRPGVAIEPLPGLSFSVKRMLTDAMEVSKPIVVPWTQRDRDTDTMQLLAMVRVELESGAWRESRWIPFHRYGFDVPLETLGLLSRNEPSTFELPDGRRVELMVARERRALPTPVALHDFSLTTHVGGFTGRVSSIRDWNSMLTFQGEDGWSTPVEISTNDPTSHDGVWFFQAFWDAPRPEVGSAGLSFTGLGVGNRQGVYTQLFGCCLSVVGMIYAFYVKPVIRRRRRQAVLADIESGKLVSRRERTSLDDTPIMADGGPPAISWPTGPNSKEVNP